MPLEIINPMTYEKFVTELGEDLDGLIGVLEQSGGWLAAFQRYQFRGNGHAHGEDIRNQYHSQLTGADGVDERIQVANEILRWGGMQPMNQLMKDNLETSLALLSNERDGDLNALFAGRIASMSKIYEMWDLNAWVIYDSYCARGLQWLVYQLWTQCRAQVHEGILRFPSPPGRVVETMNGFPQLGTPRQARLGFIYASWLCWAIASRLNENGHGGRTWQAYHIEMVAFQIGHEV